MPQLGYGYFFYRRAQVKKAGGSDAYARARLNDLFQLPVGENVTAAWEAITVPKLSKGQKAAEAISVATAVVACGFVRLGRLSDRCTDLFFVAERRFELRPAFQRRLRE